MIAIGFDILLVVLCDGRAATTSEGFGCVDAATVVDGVAVVATIGAAVAGAGAGAVAEVVLVTGAGIVWLGVSCLLTVRGCSVEGLEKQLPMN